MTSRWKCIKNSLVAYGLDRKHASTFKPELGNELGERPGAGRMGAGFSLEPLDSLDQEQFTRAQADWSGRPMALELNLSLEPWGACAQVKRLES